MPNSISDPIAVIGLGYVGLPLAAALARHFSVFGYDVNSTRVGELSTGHDRTGELSKEALNDAKQNGLVITDQLDTIRSACIYIVTVPTPIDRHQQPDLNPLIGASTTVGSVLAPQDLVIFESTVYPGTTEEVCVPVLEQTSGLKFNEGFTVGYSPERINPGDGENSLSNIIKITSGSTPAAAEVVDNLYKTIITAGTYQAPSIRIAEAAKVVENTQRDVNIALMNELAMLFHRLDIDTQEVLKAAGTKWNFLNFVPGLVGGHCIGVDPYYLAYKAQSVGHDPQLILTSRHINDAMGDHITGRIAKHMLTRQISPQNASALILGLTFKENCPDLRNSRVIDIVHGLQELGLKVDCHDPYALEDEAVTDYGLSLVTEPEKGHYDVIVLAVAHDAYRQMPAEEIVSWAKADRVIFDVKGILPAGLADDHL